MAHTNNTPNYNLPQFLGTDKPAWLTDINNAMSDIDAAIAAAKSTADTADTAVTGLAVTVGNHTSQLSTLSGAVTSQGNTLNTVTALIGNGVPTTTDQTIIGAINEINAIVQPGSVSVTADGVKSYQQLFDALFALVDLSKVTYSTKLIQTVGANNERVYTLTGFNKNPGSAFATFVSLNTSGTNVTTTSIDLHESNSIRYNGTIESGSATFTNASGTVATSGQVFTVKY